MTQPYVTRDEFEGHLKEAKDGFNRLSIIEEEVMGNEKAGRLSLRGEIARIYRAIVWMGSILITLFLAKWFTEITMFANELKNKIGH